jgi:hypothetical protein
MKKPPLTRFGFVRQLMLIRKNIRDIEASNFLRAFGMSGFSVEEMREPGHLLITLQEFMPFHESNCDAGAMCLAYDFPDAAIFVARCHMWEVALYEKADRTDAGIFMRDMKNWKAYRAVIENGE